MRNNKSSKTQPAAPTRRRALAERNEQGNVPTSAADEIYHTGKKSGGGLRSGSGSAGASSEEQHYEQQQQQQHVVQEQQRARSPRVPRRNKSRDRAVREQRAPESPTKHDDDDELGGWRHDDADDAMMRRSSSSKRSSRSPVLTCIGRTAKFVLVLSLVVMTFSCVALLLALAANGVWSHAAPLISEATPLTIDGPCEPEYFPEPMLGLPAPVRCKWSWLRLRCTPFSQCDLGVKWMPLPHPKCTVRTDDYW